MATTPRIRQELQATPVEEQGIKYFDVSDPRSGHKMRMFDFEWLVAQRMDGARPFDEVASWARERLGISPSAGDLQQYARTLEDLGFFELDDDYTPLPVSIPADSLGGNGASRSEEVQFEEEERTTPRVTATTDIKPAPAPLPVTPRVEPQKHPFSSREDSIKKPLPPRPAEKSSSMSLVWAVLVLVLLAGGVVYYQFIMPNAAVHVNVVLASPQEVVRSYEGAAPVKKAEPQALSFGEAGKLADITAKDTQVKAGQAVASLDSYGKMQKELADVKDRLGFYEKQVAAAKTRNDAEALKAAEAKVAEKQKLMSELEAKAAKLRITAPGSGSVADVLAAVGDDVKAGAPIIKIADQRMTIDFKVGPADAGTMKAGTAVQLQPASGSTPVGARVAKAEGDTVTVELLDDSTAKAGDSFRLIKSRQKNVFRLPAAAVVKREGGDTVFVLVNGEAKARKVSGVEHDGNDALIQGGLATGDSVITTAVETLTDGKKATTEK